MYQMRYLIKSYRADGQGVVMVKKGARWLLNSTGQLSLWSRLSFNSQRKNCKTCHYHYFIDGHINRRASGAHKAKSPQGGTWVAVHVIPVSLPDGVQYFSLEQVLPQQFELERVIYKPWKYKKRFDYQNVWTMRCRGQGVLDTEAVCCCIDLHAGLDFLNPAAAENPVGCVWSFMLKAYSFSTLLLSKIQPFDYESMLEKVMLHHVSALCPSLYVLFEFLISSSEMKRHVLPQPTAPFIWKYPILHPLSLYLSLLTGQSS